MSNEWKVFWKDIGIVTFLFIITALCFVYRIPILGKHPIVLLIGPAVGLFLCLLHGRPKETEGFNKIRLELRQEIGISRDPACVLIYDNDQLVAEVRAHIEQEKGADGGYYPVVKLKNILKQE